ncbi:MAG: DNA-directed RNA polymerase subunit alpha [Caldisericia bacterium]|nr:DNA-directed RNA polymerase subunit alpha [Caldisericia bacterium]
MFPLASLELKTIEEDAFLGRYTLEPLHPGYGVLIGNSLRRVMLSSIKGASPIALRIDGVPHEFSVIEGVVEDVVQIVLNLKKLVVAMDTDEIRTLTLDASGEKMVTAADIIPDIDTTIVNPELHIAELSSPNSTLRMDIMVSKKRGYVPIVKNKMEGYPIGTIWLDAMFTPVKNVRFAVEQTLIEQYLDFERLSIDILCNGAIPPREALLQGLQILSDYYTVIAQPELLKKEEEGLEEMLEEKLGQPLDTAVPGISAKTHHLLVYEGIKSLRDLLMREQDEIKAIRGISTKALAALMKALNNSPDYELISQYTFPLFGEESAVEVSDPVEEEPKKKSQKEAVSSAPEVEEEISESEEETVLETEELKIDKTVTGETDVPQEALNYQLEDISLAKHTMKFLEENGVTTLVQLVARSRDEIHEMKDFKDKIITEIENKLEKLGLQLSSNKNFESMDKVAQERTIREMKIEVFIANDVPIPSTSQKALEQKGIKDVGGMMDLGKSALKGKLKFSGKTIKTIEKRLQEWGLELKE